MYNSMVVAALVQLTLENRKTLGTVTIHLPCGLAEQ